MDVPRSDRHVLAAPVHGLPAQGAGLRGEAMVPRRKQMETGEQGCEVTWR
ncbi:hypothetical protein [Paenibacillus sp. YPG26]|nr:hypothetical protein [Paenibacillus sp. YPG26]USB35178.1 hypothetical protein LDO05_01725 [Paenibacillus sp. YPG26]